jgi:formylglycine-generating enzyme required for sulfatase activity
VSLPVGGGTYARTYTNNGGGAAGKADQATVSAFRLDKYELTVGRFRQYVNYLVAGGSPPAAGTGKHTHLNEGKGLADSGRDAGYERGWNESWNTNIPGGAGAAAKWANNLNCSPYGTWTQNLGQNEELPLTCMDWYEAHAFCIWDGGFLPSEAEWKYAAAGGDEERMYPWGSDEPGVDSQYAMYDCYYPTGTPGNCTGLSNVAKVGSTPLGLGRWGQLDLSGSVWEWCIDQYAPYVSPCTDCAYLSGAINRVLPGGGFHTGLVPYLLSSNRVAVDYATTYRGTYGVGVRCARAP